MNLIISDEQCISLNISPEEALLSFIARNTNLNDVVMSLLQKGYLEKNNRLLILSKEGEAKLKDTCKISKDVKDENSLINLANKMKECFPSGKMPGTPYYYRCNNREIINKMKKFFLIYGDYSDEDIVDATRRFIASYKGDTKFLPLIKYFILKNKTIEDEDGTKHIIEVSELATYLENKSEEVISSNDDWLSNSRN